MDPTYDRLATLRSCNLFRDVPEDILEDIASQGRVGTLPAGQMLFEEGEHGQSLIIVMDGVIDLVKRMPGRDRSLGIYRRGDVMGMASVLEPDFCHPASGLPITAVRVLELSSEHMLQLLRDNAFVYAQFLQRVASELALKRQSAAGLLDGPGFQQLKSPRRIEQDGLGEREVDASAFFGIHTLRAMESFPVTGITLSSFPQIIRALALIKKAAALANAELGHLDQAKAQAICRACDEITAGHLHAHFLVDMIQGGAGVASVMNINEVIANRALELLGSRRGEYEHLHPFQHVHLHQSIQGIYPSAVKLALITSLSELKAGLQVLHKSLMHKAWELTDVVKPARLQLRDGIPMTLGQELSAWADLVQEAIIHLDKSVRGLWALSFGTSYHAGDLQVPVRFREVLIAKLQEETGLPIEPATEPEDTTKDAGTYIELSALFKSIASKLTKIADDLTLLSSGPYAGLAEIKLPPVLPTSSIGDEPEGPVIPEVVKQVAFHVIGNDLALTMAAHSGQLQLNPYLSYICYNLVTSIDMLSNACRILAIKCIDGIEADERRTRRLAEQSLGLAPLLVARLGRETVADLIVESVETGKSFRDLILAKRLVPAEELDEIIKPNETPRPPHSFDDPQPELVTARSLQDHPTGEVRPPTSPTPPFIRRLRLFRAGEEGYFDDHATPARGTVIPFERRGGVPSLVEVEDAVPPDDDAPKDDNNKAGTLPEQARVTVRVHPEPGPKIQESPTQQVPAAQGSPEGTPSDAGPSGRTSPPPLAIVQTDESRSRKRREPDKGRPKPHQETPPAPEGEGPEPPPLPPKD